MNCPTCKRWVRGIIGRAGLYSYQVDCKECGIELERGFISLELPEQWLNVPYPESVVIYQHEVDAWVNQYAKDMRKFLRDWQEAIKRR